MVARWGTRWSAHDSVKEESWPSDRVLRKALWMVRPQISPHRCGGQGR
jgi:hypothetical protein